MDQEFSGTKDVPYTMIKINEVIVVEGKNDTKNLKRFFECDTIETHGTCLSNWTLNYIKKAQLTRGVIIFTDPDAPGNMIRNEINSKIDGCKNAFLKSDEARYKHKVGIEHAPYEVLQNALSNLMTYNKDYQETISYDEYLDLRLNSKEKRNIVSKYFNLGECNSKTLYKRLNMFKITKEEIEKVLNNE